MRVIAKAIALFFDTNTSSFARKIDYFNKIIIKSLCMWIFFCIFARNCVNGKSRRDHRLLMGKQDKGFKQIGI